MDTLRHFREIERGQGHLPYFREMSGHLIRLERREEFASLLTGMRVSDLIQIYSWITGKSSYRTSMPTYLRAKILPSSVPSHP